VLREVQSSSDKLSGKRGATFLDSNDSSGYNAYMYATAINQVINYPLVLRERIDHLVSEKNSISAQIISEISSIRDLAIGIKSLKIREEVDVGDEENFILRLKSEIETLKREEKRRSTGFCGIWKDERSADEIIDDIYSHRTGFGGRKIDL